MRSLSFAAGILLICHGPSVIGQESEPALSKERQRWTERVKEELAKLDGEQRASAAEMAIYVVAYHGDGDGAKRMLEESLPRERRAGARIGIVDAQSSSDQLAEALKTVDALATEEQKQLGLALVALRQAQRGDVEDAMAVLAKINDQRRRNYALPAIVKAQAQAGNLKKARELAREITKDDRRQEALESIEMAERNEKDPID